MSAHIWPLFILVGFYNSFYWWPRGVAIIPERRESYKKVVVTAGLLQGAPWLVFGVGSVLGRIQNFEELFQPRNGNLFVAAFHLTLIAATAVGTYWICFGTGAQAIVDHPGFGRKPVSEPGSVKLVIGLNAVLVVFIELILWFVKF